MKTFKVLVPFLKKYWIHLTVGFAFMVVQNFGFVQVPLYMKKLMDEVTGQNRGEMVVRFIGIAFAYMILTGGSMFLMRKYIIGASRFIEYEIRKILYEKLIRLDFSFYQKNQTGDLISRATNDLEHVRTLLGPGIMYIPNTLSRLAFFAPSLIALSPKLSLALLGLIIVLLVSIFLILPRMQPLHRRVQEFVGQINNRVWQVVTGIQTLKLYTREKIETERFAVLNAEYIRRHMAIAAFQGFLWPFFLTLFGASELIMLGLGGGEVIRGKMTLGELLQFNVMVGVLTFPILSFGWVMSMLQQGLAAMKRINMILEAPLLAPDPGMGEWKKLPDAKDMSIEIEAKNLSFTYPNAKNPALNGLLFRTKSGETIGITGTIGSGKTTLVGLLTGILRPARGELFVNGIDVRDLDPSELFRIVSVVPQETFLFSLSVTDNVALGPDERPDEERVRRAAKEAALDRDVEGFAEKYNQMIGERGITLSGGQKQRTAIARALYKESPLLILDDSLSSVDSKTENTILENIRTLKNRKTLLIVSHRISALKLADRIYVLDHGKVVEEGSHEVLAAGAGLYARLARMQKMQEELGIEAKVG